LIASSYVTYDEAIKCKEAKLSKVNKKSHIPKKCSTTIIVSVEYQVVQNYTHCPDTQSLNMAYNIYILENTTNT